MANNNRFKKSKLKIDQVEGTDDLFIAHNVRVRWARVHKPTEDDNGDPKYSIEMLVDKATASDFISQKLKKSLRPVKDEDDVYQISVERKGIYSKSGDPRPPASVVDSQLNPFSKEIGNDSVCNIQFAVKDWEYKKKKGTKIELTGVQVVELVPYAGSSERVAFGAVDGFVAAEEASGADETDGFEAVEEDDDDWED